VSYAAARPPDDELYLRGSETLLASWAQYARALPERRCSG
jgi:hypothetical protein